jgi:hypothetical protein
MFTFGLRSHSMVLPSFRDQIAPLEAARIQGHHHGVCISAFGFGFAMNSVRFPESRTIADFLRATKRLFSFSARYPSTVQRLLLHALLPCFS